LSFCPVSFCHCVVYPSLNYGFWSTLWHHQTSRIRGRNTFRSIPCQ
jgi:hypothetical protein